MKMMNLPPDMQASSYTKHDFNSLQTSTNRYRFSFNGKRKDDEVKGKI